MVRRRPSKSAHTRTPTQLPVNNPAPLESVLCTEELYRRPSRPPDYEKENRTLVTLAQSLANSPEHILQTLADTILAFLNVDSSGVSLLTKDGKHFYWPAIAGEWSPHISGGTPRDFGPCGDVLDRGTPLMFRHFEKRYTYFQPVTPPVEECLLVPIYIRGKAVGTIWAITHSDRRKFDAEDLRQLTSIGVLASAACEVIVVSESARDLRLAALNVMEDAVQARSATEIMNAELRVSEERYRTLFDSIDEGFVIIEKVDAGIDDPADFRYVEVNPAFEEQSGLQGVIGRTLKQVIPLEAVGWSLIFDMVLKTGEPVRLERALFTTQRMLEFYAFRVAHERRRVAVIFKDVTSRRMADQARANLAAIVRSSDDAIFSQDPQGIITSWNAGAERLFGYTAPEALGNSLAHLIPPQESDGALHISERILRAVGVEHHEILISRRTGDMVDISLTISPISTPTGEVVGASTIARDISGYRKATEALHESDRRKDEFLAMLAHELRNPLAPIRNSLEIIRRTWNAGSLTSRPADAPGHQPEVPGFEPSDNAVDSSMQIFDRQISQLTRLIDDLVDANRIRRGKIELRKEPLTLASIVHEVMQSIRPQCESLGHEVTVTLPPEPVYLIVDPVRLTQILGNLLSNACKFTGRGGHIWLTVERREASSIDIRVRDNGIGIAEDDLGRIFDLFTQVDQSLERSLGGLGIGLALVKTLTQMHGGIVEARSAGLGEGAEFLVRLPTTDSPPAPAPQPIVAGPLVAPTFRILVVDDSRDAADSLAVLLRLEGHETHVAYDGLAAVETAARLQPDVILLDIGLPILNGYEAARTIREQERDKRPLLVALTGWGKEEDRQRSREAGFDAHVVKPVECAALGNLMVELGAARKTGN